MRFQLRTVFVLLTLCALGATYWHYSLDYPAVQVIATREEWDRAIPHGECVVFVMGDWNFESVFMQRELEPFSSWTRRRGVRVLTLTMDPNLVKNDVWKISEKIIQKNRLYAGSMKNLNGAGRVLWFKNGKLVDHAWGPGQNWSYGSYESYLQFLKDRTEMAFR